jgi:hypothetical protein
MTTSSPWLNEEKFVEEVLDSEVENERKLKLELLDVAGVYHYNDAD